MFITPLWLLRALDALGFRSAGRNPPALFACPPAHAYLPASLLLAHAAQPTWPHAVLAPAAPGARRRQLRTLREALSVMRGSMLGVIAQRRQALAAAAAAADGVQLSSSSSSSNGGVAAAGAAAGPAAAAAAAAAALEPAAAAAAAAAAEPRDLLDVLLLAVDDEGRPMTGAWPAVCGGGSVCWRTRRSEQASPPLLLAC